MYEMSPETHYIRLYLTNENSEDFMFEQGDKKTSYVEKMENSKHINLIEPLRSVSEKYRDRIIKVNGRWMIERNIGVKVLDGSENWYMRNDLPENDPLGDSLVFQVQDLNLGMKVRPHDVRTIATLTDILPSIPHWDGWYTSREGFHIGTYDTSLGVNNCRYYISIKSSRLNDKSLNSFKNWLSNNNITLFYALEEPIYESLGVGVNLDTYLENTYIETNAMIQPNLKVTVDRIANIAVSYIEKAISEPSTVNISNARFWVNQMNESYLKDLFQDNLNNIYSVSDLSLEKKNVTANIDVYIKSSNTLSLSLDTNSVTFENFSGVDDMEKLNAVNLTISSSLPYKINAYLASEIQNADKTNTMDRNILNIKASSESTYSAFIDTITPIILLDDQSKGNDITHGIDLKLNGNISHKKDVYKTTIRFEVEQK